MFPNSATLDDRGGGLNGGERGLPPAEGRSADAVSQAREQWLAAERALDEVLADSFPASDPPPWTLGVSRREK